MVDVSDEAIKVEDEEGKYVDEVVVVVVDVEGFWSDGREGNAPSGERRFELNDGKLESELIDIVLDDEVLFDAPNDDDLLTLGALDDATAPNPSSSRSMTSRSSSALARLVRLLRCDVARVLVASDDDKSVEMDGAAARRP